jgi:hypothetical protein
MLSITLVLLALQQGQRTNDEKKVYSSTCEEGALTKGRTD